MCNVMQEKGKLTPDYFTFTSYCRIIIYKLNGYLRSKQCLIMKNLNTL